jgi:hypothetical protein
VNVETVLRISSIIEPTGASFVDGSIIGPHPVLRAVQTSHLSLASRLGETDALVPAFDPRFADRRAV